MKEVDIVSFADDNTPSMSDSNITNLAEDLEDSAHAKTEYKGTEPLLFLAPKIWELIPESVKSIDLLLAFKIAIKQ